MINLHELALEKKSFELEWKISLERFNNQIRDLTFTFTDTTTANQTFFEAWTRPFRLPVIEPIRITDVT